ncbi:MAG: hypothetical protein KDC28_09190 [Saprospiraceae bacterium]|nr:hypothetical protein [Saprospiraceae bacterium]MCB9320328.1 hypothetical protein [Lewinellaceae bacterium]
MKFLAQPLLLGFFFLIYACQKQSSPTGVESSHPLIVQYTSGPVNPDQPIRIRFKQGFLVDQVASSIHLTGGTGFHAIALDSLEIQVSPDPAWPKGGTITMQLNMRQLFGNTLTGQDRTQLTFGVKEQHMSVISNGLTVPDVLDADNMALGGSVQLAIPESGTAVEELITASQGTTPLAINWQHQGQYHSFLIEGIKRENTASVVTLAWSGKEIQSPDQGKLTIDVPAKGAFIVLGANVEAGSPPSVKITFSDPLNTGQDYTGLVYLQGQDLNYRYQTDGNQLWLYPDKNIKDVQQLVIDGNVENVSKNRFGTSQTLQVRFDAVAPAIHLLSKGAIIPQTNQALFQFEAVALNKIDVEIYQVHESNILQFLQVNTLSGNNELDRVADRMRTVTLDLTKQVNTPELDTWTTYQVDLTPYFAEQPHAFYQIRLSFRPEYARTACTMDWISEIDPSLQSPWEYGYFGALGYYPNFWDERDDPCRPAFYNDEHFLQQTLLATQIGLLAKRSDDGELFVVTTDLPTGKPLPNVDLRLYTFAQQEITSLRTDADGFARYTSDGDHLPVFITAKLNQDQAYLNLLPGQSISLSQFDVSGVTRADGLQCFIYGERGVWRPGDTLFLHAIMENASTSLPENYPLRVSLMDPQGKLVQEKTQLDHSGPIYPIQLVTSPDAPTGNWEVTVRAGGAIFAKTVKIETIKPNRIKMELEGLPEDILAANTPITLKASWLFGSPARNLDAKVELSTRPMQTVIPGFSQYNFDDPGRRSNAISDETVLFDGTLNDGGQTSFDVKTNFNQAVGGMVKAELITRVFEQSGDFSTRYLTRIISPYSSYAGILIPADEYGSKRFDKGKEAKISVINADASGKALPGRKLDVAIYQVGWSWWYESDDDRFYRYSNGNEETAIFSTQVTTDRNGQASISWTPDQTQGYFIRVCDNASGHCAGDVFYVGYPWDDDEHSGTSYLTLQTNEKRYEVDDQIEVEIPVSHPGKVLITVERQDKVLSAQWFDASTGNQKIRIPALASYAPFAYISVVLLQGTVRDNDLPIRSFGVIPVEVYYPERRLDPVVSAPASVRPEVPFTIKVNEGSKREMQYTVAIVDEGLLDLTSYSTPDPYLFFNRKEALGVQTWDVYDQVIASFFQGGRLLAIGGDGAATVNPGNQEMRFKPVVRVLGPFTCAPGKTNSHEVTIHNYIGSVRIMVVAASEAQAYGHAEQAVKVEQPLMVLATAPRKLSPGEEAYLPVNLFASDKALGATQVNVSASSPLIHFTRSDASMNISQPGDAATDFSFTVADQIGQSTLTIEAKHGSEKAIQTLTIPVKNPNPYLTRLSEAIIQAGGTQLLQTELPGMNGTNTATLELSTMPALNLQRRLEYLIHYPYGCAEQTTSSAFPQLYLSELADLSPTQKASITTNVLATIDRLKQFQHADGGFTFWPGATYMDEYITSYVGHFLLLAKSLGYPVPSNMMDRWKKIQRRWSNTWSPSQEKTTGGYAYGSSIQIYRLYTLALAGDPDVGSMNRLRESTAITPQDFYRLAASYALAGRVREATKMLTGKKPVVLASPDWSSTYGDELRDQALLLDALRIIGMENDAAAMAKTVAEALNSAKWYSTQSLAYALQAVTSYYLDDKSSSGGMNATVQYQGKTAQNIQSERPLFVYELSPSQLSTNQISVQNNGQKTLFAKWIITGKPLDEPQMQLAQKVSLNISYLDLDGKPLDPAQIKQGTDFKIVAKVTHQTGLRSMIRDLALTIGVPSGWEILPVRLSAIDATTELNYDYQDIRDDRVDTFFDLDAGQSKTFTILVHAAYAGRFRLPTQLVEAMYDHSIQATVPGGWVEVARKE